MEQGALFDSEAIDVMRRALDEAIAKLPAELRSNAIKVEMASCILKAASAGERNVPRLCAAALLNAIGRHGTLPGKPIGPGARNLATTENLSPRIAYWTIAATPLGWLTTPVAEELCQMTHDFASGEFSSPMVKQLVFDFVQPR
jgi:hypothetical protein